jgi:hypothetical protein
MSFLNATTYPPSLIFVFVTLGPALAALLLRAAFLCRASRGGGSWSFLVYGRAARAFVVHPVPSMGGPCDLFPADFEFELPGVYVLWALIVATMYPLCRWFAGVKARRREWWVSYL